MRWTYSGSTNGRAAGASESRRSHQSSDSDVEGLSHPSDVQHAHVPLPALNLAHVGAVDTCRVRERLLRKGALQSDGADGFAQLAQLSICIRVYRLAWHAIPVAPSALMGHGIYDPYKCGDYALRRVMCSFVYASLDVRMLMLDTARFIRLLAAIALSWTAYGGYGLSDAYGQRVAGESSSPASPAGMTTQADPNGAVMLRPGVKIEDLSIDEILHTSPEELGNTRRPLGPQAKAPSVADQRKAAEIEALTRRSKQAAPVTDLASDLALQNAGSRAEADKRNAAGSTPYAGLFRIFIGIADPVLIFVALWAGYVCRRWWWVAPVAGYVLVHAYNAFGRELGTQSPSDELSAARWVLAGAVFAGMGWRSIRSDYRKPEGDKLEVATVE